MSNIRTLKDLEKQESRPSSQAFPVPDSWRNAPAQPRFSTSGNTHSPNAQRYQFFYTGIDGERYLMQDNPTPISFCCLSCCPCFVPPFCDPDKQQQYRNLLKTFCFWISAVQFVLLIVALGMGGFAPYDTNPSLGPPSSTLVELGAKYGPLMREGQVWRFIVPVFLHAGIFHLIFNLFAQLRFGLVIEKKWGIPKFIVVYFLSAIGGVLMSALLRPDVVSVGASGALLGLMGAYVSEVLLTWHKTEPNMRRFNLIQSVLVIGITMLFSASPYIDAAAHFGGLLVGFLVTSALFGYEAETEKLRRWIPIVSVTITATYFILGFALFYTVVKV